MYSLLPLLSLSLSRHSREKRERERERESELFKLTLRIKPKCLVMITSLVALQLLNVKTNSSDDYIVSRICKMKTVTSTVASTT